ncbi:SOS response-associated peptidase [Brucella pseudintermedia]|uniref:SOS response-associated peptidase n=1 Tax=Brucella pseudintermedia TaxID=370111 RepID=A0ABY5UA99_9HYPH|nr:SOS response-associated peptidase [Brucella pseudintermedia]UWL60268.1 SOS response-associated peptidase [Brucella pseudintermedia]
MCGRYTLYLPWSEIHRLYNLTLMSDQARNTQPRYNICPTQDVLFVTHSDEGMKLREGRWGLVPFWAKELGNFSTSRCQKRPIKNNVQRGFQEQAAPNPGRWLL